MRASLYFLILIFLLLPVVSVNADCPECFGEMPPMSGRASEGRPSTINGRPAISVRIEGSWDTSPGSHQTIDNVWGAVNQALTRWNNATDTSGNSS